MLSIPITTLYDKLFQGYRAAGIFLLYILWSNFHGNVAGLFLLLTLVTLMLFRARFPKQKWTLLLDQFVIAGAALLWPGGRYALALSVFEAAYWGIPYVTLPTLLLTLLSGPDGLLLLILAQSAFAGTGLWGWRLGQESALRRMDEERSRYYAAESVQRELLAANAQVARLAQLSERSRLAHEIHDKAGHETVAAYMSLQTAQSLWDEDAGQARELLEVGLLRLERGMEQIREAARDMAPNMEIGIQSLRRLCEDFPQCPVSFLPCGDTSRVSVFLWAVLEACLKEAFANILRHADARQVSVTLDITPHIIRLCVDNDGVRDHSSLPAGIGLRSLQQRAQAVGGNISVTDEDGFRLVCVLPLDQKGGC